MATMGRMNIAVHVDGDAVGGGLGRAHWMAIATIEGGEITNWEEFEVGWDELHGTGAPGTHHARIVRFMREHDAQAVVTGHMGPPMVNTMTKLKCRPFTEMFGNAKEMALQAARILEDEAEQG